MIELPLCAVRMIRIGSLPRRNTQNLDIKGMPLVEVGGLGLASQRLRNLFARTAERSLRRAPCELCHLCCIDFVHKRSVLTLVLRRGGASASGMKQSAHPAVASATLLAD